MTTVMETVQATSLESKPLPIEREVLALLDWMKLRFSPVYYGIGIPHGDGSAVILVPGFLGADIYLIEMYLWLWQIGYHPYMSRIGQNAECPNILCDRLIQTIEKAFQETGRRVCLIGHSLGGTIALSAAISQPDQVAQVVTLASPFRSIVVNPLIRVVADAVRISIFLRHNEEEIEPNCYTPTCGCSFTQRLRKEDIPDSVDTIAVYSKSDGVVGWKGCIYEDSRLNREIRGGTHVGLAFHPDSYVIIAEELSRCLESERAVA